MEVLVVALALLSNFLQLYLMVKEKVKTPRLSWIIWFVIIVLCFIINLLFNGWDTTTYLLAAYSFGNGLITIYILKKNPRGWTKRETKLLAVVIVVLLLWIPFKIIEAEKMFLWATVTSLILLRATHFIGVWEYWIKVKNDPFTESISVWLMRWSSALLACLHIFYHSKLTKGKMLVSFSNSAYLCLTVTVTVLIILLQRKRLKH